VYIPVNGFVWQVTSQLSAREQYQICNTGLIQAAGTQTWKMVVFAALPLWLSAAFNRASSLTPADLVLLLVNAL
jgi:hypothetical protein